MAKRPLTLLFDASPLLVNRTGIAYYIEQLAANLAAQYPHDIELIGFYYNFLGRKPTGHFPTAPNLRYRQISLMPAKIVYQLRRFNIEIPVELLTRSKPDFILYTNFIGYPSLFHVPSATVVHDLTYLDLPEYVAAKNRSDLERFVPKEIRRSQFVATVSEFSKQRIIDTYAVPPDQIVVTPIPPIPTVIFSDKQRRETLSKLGITKPFVLFVGTFEPRKNLANLMAAYTQLPKALRAAYTLVLTGRLGWNCQAEEQLLARLKTEGYDIVHLGYVDEDARAVLYQSATLFTSASHYEGFGMPVLEAMSYGTPCALSDIPVFREVAVSSAEYFDQADPGSISHALEQLLTNKPRLKALGKQAQEHAQTFTWETIARSLYTTIAAHIR